MNDAVELADRLRPVAGKIVGWRADAERISSMMLKASESNSDDPGALERIEGTAGPIFRGERGIPFAPDRSCTV